MKKSVPAALVLIGVALVVLLVWMNYWSSSAPADIAPGTEQARVSESLFSKSLNSEDRNTGPRTSAASPGVNTRINGSADDAFSDNAPNFRWSAAEDTLLDPNLVDDEQDDEHVIGGMVIDEEGVPLAGIEVLASQLNPERRPSSNFDQMGPGVLSVFSDSDGAFLFRNLDDGSYRLRIAPAEGIAPTQTTVRVGPLNVKLVVAFQWEITVHGTVSSKAGRPLKNTQVTAGRQSPGTRTGLRGEYVFDVSLQGINRTRVIHFRREGYRDQKVYVDPRELDYRDTELQVDVIMERLIGQTTVKGSLMDTEGRALPGRPMTIASPGLRTNYRAQSDVNGEFVFRKVEPARDYRLHIVEGSGYKDKTIHPLEVPPSGLKLDIVLELADKGELSGWMLDLEGNPVPGFELYLHSRVVAVKPVRVVGDQQGFFSVQDFPVGDATLRTNSYPVFAVSGFRVSAQPEEPITVVLDLGPHVLEGWVIDNLGEPVAADSVGLSWTFNLGSVQSSSSRKTTADREGYFVFTDLGPGVHRMWIGAPGFKKQRVDIDTGIKRGEFIVELEELP